MVYLLVSIDYYIQIRKIDQELADAIQAELTALQSLYGYEKMAEREGGVLYRFVKEFGIDTRRTM